MSDGDTAREGAAGPPPLDDNELAITFLYYRDLPAAMRFYEEIVGLPLAIDQGWSKIYRIAGGAHVGLVDETRGMHRAHPVKPVQLCVRVKDVEAWHAWAAACHVPGLTAPKTSDELGIRAFVMNDPEGYQIEIQSATR